MILLLQRVSINAGKVLIWGWGVWDFLYATKVQKGGIIIVSQNIKYWNYGVTFTHKPQGI